MEELPADLYKNEAAVCTSVPFIPTCHIFTLLQLPIFCVQYIQFTCHQHYIYVKVMIMNPKKD